MNVWLRRQQNRLGYRMRTLKVNKFIMFLVLLLILFWAAGSYYVRTFRPHFSNVAGSAMSQHLEVAINKAVSEQLKSQGITFDNLVITQKNTDGDITSIQANTVLMNLIKTEVSNQVTKTIGDTETQDFSIPLGNFFGNVFLSGRGPKIHMKAVPYGSCSVTFHSQFSDAGINQTKFQINMEVKTKIAVLPPFGNTTFSELSSTFPIGETVIVGKVPNTYAGFDSASSRSEDSIPLLDQ